MNAEPEAPECLEQSDECQGKVEFHTTGNSLRAWPRCTFHADKRQDRYEGSLEQEARSPLPPSWFDPTAAGERWNEDD